MRTYPAHDIAANLVGFVGTDEPYGGLEEIFDKALSGKDGSEKYEVGAGNRIPLGDNTTVPAVDGQDLHTTIDRDLQWYTQRVLRQAVENAGGSSGIAVIMDSRTGEILALADDPTFDADDPAASPVKDRRARSLNLSYEPGSVEKVLTLSALIDTGQVTARTKMLVPGELHRQDRVIHDHWDHGLIKLTLAGVLAKSSNVGTVLAADKFGPGELRTYLDKFGLGRPTNVGLGAESRGILPDPSIWTEPDRGPDRLRPVAVGERRADGRRGQHHRQRRRPHRPDPDPGPGHARRRHGDRHRRLHHPPGGQRAKAARQMTLMMERVVDPEDGVAPLANVPGLPGGRQDRHRAAGRHLRHRCGQAQLLRRHHHGLLRRLRPGREPAVHDLRRHPGTDATAAGGGSTAGPVFSKLMGFTLQRYGVAPSDRKQTRPAGRVVDQRACRVVSAQDPTGATAADAARRPRRLAARASTDATATGDLDTVVTGLTLSSQRCLPGDLYAALPGARAHGMTYAADALAGRRGRTAHRRRPGPRTRRPAYRCSSCAEPRRLLGRLAARVYGEPATSMRMIGVTGTQGKTTTTRLAEGGLQSGRASAAGVIGTVGTRIDGEDVEDLAHHARGAGPARAVRGDARARGRGLRDGGLAATRW